MANILIACVTSYQNCGCGISIRLHCFVAKQHFLSYCNDLTKFALVGPGPVRVITMHVYDYWEDVVSVYPFIHHLLSS